MRSLWTYSALLTALMALTVMVADILAGSGKAAETAQPSGILEPLATALSCLALGLISTSVLRFAENSDMFAVVSTIALIPLACAGFPHGLIFCLFFVAMCRQVKGILLL